MTQFKIKKILLAIFVGILIAIVGGCSATISDTKFEKQDVTTVYTGSSISKYFLSGLPAWANFSSVGNCFRNKEIIYLDLKEIHQNFGYDYFKALNTQLEVNYIISKRPQMEEERGTSIEKRERLFKTALGKIEAGIYRFKGPEFNAVNLVWIDPFLKEDKRKYLDEFLKKDLLNNAPIVLLSTCLNYDEMERIFTQEGHTEFIKYFISSELFSAYSSNLEKSYIFSIDLNKLLKKSTEINFDEY